MTVDTEPEFVPTNTDGEPAGSEHPGAPTAEELAADENLYPTPNVDDDAAVDENGD